MNTMYIYKILPTIGIEVDGYPKEFYFDYSMREAEKRYREKYGLKGVHLSKDFRRSHWEINLNGYRWVF